MYLGVPLSGAFFASLFFHFGRNLWRPRAIKVSFFCGRRKKSGRSRPPLTAHPTNGEEKKGGKKR